MRIVGFAITVLGMLFQKAEATAASRPRVEGGPGGPAPEKRSRREGRRARPGSIRPTLGLADRSACPRGVHTAAVQDGAVYLDGRRVSSTHAVHVVQAPTWRQDGGALAWVERDVGVVRLQVLPDLSPGTRPIGFTLPAGIANERVLWSGRTKVVVGPHVLAPRAIATWSDS
jgi:hypothetical protein